MSNENTFVELDASQAESISGGLLIPYPRPNPIAIRIAVWLAKKMKR